MVHQEFEPQPAPQREQTHPYADLAEAHCRVIAETSVVLSEVAEEKLLRCQRWVGSQNELKSV